MRIIGKLLVFTIIAALSAAAQDMIRENVQFKDVNGNSYDLYEELDKGKHVFLTFVKAQF